MSIDGSDKASSASDLTLHFLTNALQVAMDDPLLVRRLERLGNLPGERASRSGSEATASGSTLIATWRFRFVSVARYTSPIPPTPICAVTSYGPRRAPGVRDTTDSSRRDYRWLGADAYPTQCVRVTRTAAASEARGTWRSLRRSRPTRSRVQWPAPQTTRPERDCRMPSMTRRGR